MDYLHNQKLQKFLIALSLSTFGFATLGAGCASAQQAPVAPPVASNNPADVVFTFQDYLNRDWNNEAVRISLTPAQAQRAQAKSTLIGPEGQPVEYQIVPQATGQATAIEFLANVKANEKSTYRFAAANTAVSSLTSDLKVVEDASTIRLTNKHIGIALRKKLEAGEGPIENIRLNSGAWVGGSRLDPKLVPTSYTARVLQQGLVFSEVECRTEFGGSSVWLLKFRLNDSEPVVTVDETMSLGEKSSTFSLSLSESFNPEKILFRYGQQVASGSIGLNATENIKPGIAFVLEPWLHWSERPTQGPVFSVYNAGSPDMLSVGAGFAADWVDPNIPAKERLAPRATAIQDESGLHLDFLLKNGKRHWMIGAFDKESSLEVVNSPELPYNVKYSPSIPHQYVIKHGQFPLNLVKDWKLEWDAGKESYPHLLVTKAQVAKFRAANAKAEPVPAQEISRIINTRPLSQWTMTDPISVFLRTGNESVGKYLATEGQVRLQHAVEFFTKQPTVPYGTAPHHQQVIGEVPLIVDPILDSPHVTPEERKRILAQLAFISYAINRPDYWSEERGYMGLANMTTSVLGYQVAMASAIPTHPEAREWVSAALAGLRQQLYDYSDSNGGWLEAPHYAMVSYDAILGSALMAHNAGLSDMIFDPQMKKVINWFSKWSTPKDARFGYRHLPPVGHTYIGEPTGNFGIVAPIWKQKDPEFAAQMQWMHREHGSPKFPGIGGGYPTMAGYREILTDPTIPAKAPPWGSELFPKTGVLLRNKFPSERETQLLLLAGSFGGWRSHWDDDSGSITLWGKGRIIADDFGYYSAPIDDQSLPSSPEIIQARKFNVETFAPSKDLDYVSGARGPWQRQIAFLKNEDPLAPNYFVVSDTFKTAAPATWRMWFTANAVMPGEKSTLVEGKEDVDTDVFFVTAGDLQLKTEEKTRTSGAGVRPDKSQGPTPTTQIGLIASAPTDGTMTYVLYPRLKSENPPIVNSLADGKVIEIKSEAGTDYIFQSATPFTWSQGTMSFSGKSGAIRFRDKQLVMTLGEKGTVAARGQTLTSPKAARKEVKR